jgi:hypothetical protein
MIEVTPMFICEKCREMVDPASPDVIALEHWAKLPAPRGVPDAWVQAAGAHFHRRHAPNLGLEWRRPRVLPRAMAEAAPGQDAPLPLDEP